MAIGDTHLGVPDLDQSSLIQEALHVDDGSEAESVTGDRKRLHRGWITDGDDEFIY